MAGFLDPGDPTLLMLSLVAGGVGLVLFIYGKKQSRVPHLVAGVLFMVYPYFVSGAATLLAVGVALAAGLWWAVRRGW